MTTLIGTNPDQVPVNSMLGGMAYQDPDSINVKDFNSSGTANITDVSYSGTLTGGTGVINIGNNQIYKDVSGNIGFGTNSFSSLVASGRMLVEINGTSDSAMGFKAAGGLVGYLYNSPTTFRIATITSTPISLFTNNTEKVRIESDGNLISYGTGALKLQEGTTAQRPASPQEGMIRKNSTLGVIEGYSGGGYVSLEAGRLIGISEFRTTGVDSTFNVNTKTTYMIVEMVGGGGGGGGYTGSFTNNTVGLGYSGTPGCGVRFLIRNSDMASTFYYRIGAGGAGSSTSAGSDGASTIFSKEPTSGTMTNNILAGGGKGGFVGSISAPPVLLQPALFPSLNQQGTAANWVILESSGGYTGESVYSLTSELPALRTRTQLDSNNQIANQMNCFYIHLYGHHGSGGGGREGKQTSGGTFTSIWNATGGYPGMIRIYEYS